MVRCCATGMGMDLPEELHWIGWVAGSAWPSGDETKMFELAGAWERAAAELLQLPDDIVSAKRAAAHAYSAGLGGEAIGGQLDLLLNGPQSVPELAAGFQQLGATTFATGSDLEAAKITVIISLVTLVIEIAWARLFPVTAAAGELAAILSTRSFLRRMEDWLTAAIKGRIANAALSDFVGTYTVKILETVLISSALDAFTQGVQFAAGHRREYNWRQTLISMGASAAGTIPGREVAGWVGRRFDAHAAAYFRGAAGASGVRALKPVAGNTVKGLASGAASGVVSTFFGNLVMWPALGSFGAAFGSGEGWAGGMGRSAAVGGARGALAYRMPSANGRMGRWRGVFDPTLRPGGDGTLPPPPRADGLPTARGVDVPMVDLTTVNTAPREGSTGVRVAGEQGAVARTNEPVAPRVPSNASQSIPDRPQGGPASQLSMPSEPRSTAVTAQAATAGGAAAAVSGVASAETAPSGDQRQHASSAPVSGVAPGVPAAASSAAVPNMAAAPVNTADAQGTRVASASIGASSAGQAPGAGGTPGGRAAESGGASAANGAGTQSPGRSPQGGADGQRAEAARPGAGEAAGAEPQPAGNPVAAPVNTDSARSTGAESTGVRTDSEPSVAPTGPPMGDPMTGPSEGAPQISQPAVGRTSLDTVAGQEVTVVRKPDGTEVRTDGAGRRSVVGPDGTVQRVDAEGRPTVTVPDGVEYRFEADGAVRILDSQIERTISAGHDVTTVHRDGVRHEVDPRTGTVRVTSPDGTAVVIRRDGVVWAVAADGTTVRRTGADGTTFAVDEDGTIHVNRPDGKDKTYGTAIDGKDLKSKTRPKDWKREGEFR